MDDAMRSHHRNLSSNDLKELLVIYRRVAPDVLEIAGAHGYGATHGYMNDIIDILKERNEL